MVKLLFFLFIYLSNNLKGFSRFFFFCLTKYGIVFCCTKYADMESLEESIQLSSRSIYDQSSELQQINVDALQSSLLGLTLFINNLTKDNLRSLVNIYLYTDNTTVYGCTFKIWMIPRACQLIPLLTVTPTGSMVVVVVVMGGVD